MSTRVQLELQHIFGLRQEARNYLLFLDEQTIIFPSGNYCVLYNIDEQRIQFIQGATQNKQEPKSIKALAISPDCHYLAVSACRKQSIITVYNLQSKNRRQVLKGSRTDFQFTCMAFSADSKYLLGQAAGPEWTLFYWDWEMDEVIFTVKTTTLGFVTQVSFNPWDNTQICVSGNDVFKVFKVKYDALHESVSSGMDLKNITSHAWMSDDCIVLGTEAGKLLMLKDGHLLKLRRPTERKTSTDTLPSITAITGYSKGFACIAGPDLVCLYEKAGKYSYEKMTEIRIPQDPCMTQLEQQEITTMCVSPSENTLAICTYQGQIYRVNLTSIENSKVPEQQRCEQAHFDFLFNSLHSGSITRLSTCTSKHLVATCSKDNTLRIWNYKTKSLELYKEFPEEPNCISLHPNGLSILMGFSDEVCLMNLLVDGFDTVRKFNIHNCNECLFNHGGNMFAAVTNKLIIICNVRTGKKVELNSHTTKVLSVMWSEDDRRLVSCGTDGAVYEWNALTDAVNEGDTTTETVNKGDTTTESVNEGDTTTDANELENMQNSCTYIDAIFLPSTGGVLAVSSDYTLKELRDGEILKEMASDGVAYTAMSVTHSSQAIFIGTAAGTIRVMQIPLEEKSWTEYQAHSGPVRQIAVTPDDQYLLTASEDGSLLIWTITDQEGCRLSMTEEVDYTEELLCTKAFLQRKNECIQEAYTQMESLKKQHECELNQKHLNYEKRMNNIMQNNQQQIETLKEIVEVLNTDKEVLKKRCKELKVAQLNVLSVMRAKHAEELKSQERNHDRRMLKAFEKHQELKQEMQAMQQKHAEKLREQEDDHFRTTQEQKRACNDRLQDQQEKLEKSEQKVKELTDQRVDQEVKAVILQYNQELQVEKEITMILENEMRLMNKQIKQLWNIKGEMQDHCHEISQLEAKFEAMSSNLFQNKEEFQITTEALNRKLLTERKRANNMEALVHRMKEDIKNCSSFIHNPKMLHDNFKKLHKNYIHGDMRPVQEHTKQKVHLQRTLVSLEQSQAMKAKNQQAECSSFLKQQVKKSEKMQTALTMNEEAELKELCLKYEQELQVEKETNSRLQYEMKLMETQLGKIKREIEDQDQWKKVKNLQEKKQEQNKTIHDQKEMHKKSRKQNKDDLVSISTQLEELHKDQRRPTRRTTELNLEQLQNRIQEKKQLFKKLEEQLGEIDVMGRDTIFCLMEKLQQKEQQLCTEKQKVRNIKTLVERMKADIQNCSSFIQHPRMLRENFMKLHNSYVPEAEQSAMPAKELNQEKPKIYQHRTQIPRTNGILKVSTTSKDSQQKSGKGPVNLPRLQCTRIQRPKVDIRNMGQGQPAHQGSLGSVKLPLINNTRHTR